MDNVPSPRSPKQRLETSGNVSDSSPRTSDASDPRLAPSPGSHKKTADSDRPKARLSFKSLGRSSISKVAPALGLDGSDVEDSNWSIEVEGHHTTSGLLTSYTVYVCKWKNLTHQLQGVVEHRYSDFLSLYNHLQRVFAPPFYSYPPFPKKERFVLMSERDQLADHRLSIFKDFVKIFEVYREMWADPKVQRFFELPSELRGGKSARTGVASPRKESSPRTDKVVKGATTGTPGEMRKGSGAKTHMHRRSGSDILSQLRNSPGPMQPITFVDAQREKGRATLNAEALGDIRRSGSDMYLSSILAGTDDEHSSNQSPAPTASHNDSSGSIRSSFNSSGKLNDSSSSIATPFGTRSSDSGSPRAVQSPAPTHSVPGTTDAVKETDAVRPETPPTDVSPVFARKGMEVVHVPSRMQANSRIRCLADFQVSAMIGRGGFGSVFLATETTTGLVVAIKRMAKSTIERTRKVKQIQMELGVLKLARIKQNRWIVQLHYSFQDDHYLYLAMQYCPGGDLRHLMDNCDMDEATAKVFAAEICVCVHQLHALGFVHRDLKPENFLISQRGHLKLADFGLSEHGFLQETHKERHHSSVGGDQLPSLEFSSIVVYFPPSAGEVRARGDLSSTNLDGNATEPSMSDADLGLSELADDEGVNALKDEKGRPYKRVKVFVSKMTTCADVIDTLKHKLDIRKQVPYQLLEVAYINEHMHERVVRNDELVEQLFSSFNVVRYRHKFIFKRSMMSAARMRSVTNAGEMVAQPLSQSRAKLFQVVGSPAYMAKEILLGEGYESEVDWWSVGVIIYEMLFGVAPFSAPTPEAVFAKILQFQRITFPDQPSVSDSVKDLMSHLICAPNMRLGAHGGLAEVRTHAWFREINFSELQYSSPPFLPELDSQLDVGYFPQAITENVEKYYAMSSSSMSSSDFQGGSNNNNNNNNSSASTGNDSVIADEDLWKDFSWSWFS